ncbi:MAG: hypothetical protein M9947_02130 [Thermomicrobiales bacterium]|nr:hypothetical protein [Thermomicrobiales bacterium]
MNKPSNVCGIRMAQTTESCWRVTIASGRLDTQSANDATNEVDETLQPQRSERR